MAFVAQNGLRALSVVPPLAATCQYQDQSLSCPNHTSPERSEDMRPLQPFLRMLCPSLAWRLSLLLLVGLSECGPAPSDHGRAWNPARAWAGHLRHNPHRRTGCHHTTIRSRRRRALCLSPRLSRRTPLRYRARKNRRCRGRTVWSCPTGLRRRCLLRRSLSSSEPWICGGSGEPRRQSRHWMTRTTT